MLQALLTGSLPQTNVNVTAVALSLSVSLDRVAQAAGPETYQQHVIVTSIWAHEGPYVKDRLSELAKRHTPGESTAPLMLAMTDFFHPTEVSPVLSAITFNFDRVASTVAEMLKDIRVVSAAANARG